MPAVNLNYSDLFVIISCLKEHKPERIGVKLVIDSLVKKLEAIS